MQLKQCKCSVWRDTQASFRLPSQAMTQKPSQSRSQKFTLISGQVLQAAVNLWLLQQVALQPPHWGLQVGSPALAANNLSDYITASESTSAKPIYGVSERRYMPGPALLSHCSPMARCSSPCCPQAGITQHPEKV